MEVSCSDHGWQEKARARVRARETALAQRLPLRSLHCTLQHFPGLISPLNLLRLRRMQKGCRRHKSPSVSHNVSMLNSALSLPTVFFFQKRCTLLRRCIFYKVYEQLIITPAAPSGINCPRRNLSVCFLYWPPVYICNGYKRLR